MPPNSNPRLEWLESGSETAFRRRRARSDFWTISPALHSASCTASDGPAMGILHWGIFPEESVETTLWIYICIKILALETKVY